MGKSIRILHITHANGGGVLRHIEQLYNNLDKTRFEQRYICNSDSLINKKMRGLNAQVDNIKMLRQISPVKDIKAIRAIKKAISGMEKPDIVHVHSSKAGVLGRLACRKLKIPLIYTPHSWAFDMKTSKLSVFLYKIIERNMSRYCDKIVQVSQAECDSAVRHGINKEKLTVVPNAVELYRFLENSAENGKLLSEKLGLQGDSTVIGMVGRLEGQKNPEMFVKVANEMLKTNKDIHFALIGDGKMEPAIRAQIDGFGIGGNVHLTGWLEDVEGYLKSLSLALQLSRWEGLSITLLELMAAGVCVAVSDIDGNREVIRDNQNGLMIAENLSEKEIADKILKLLSDGERMQTLTENARETVREHYNIDRLTRQYEQLYGEIASK